MTDRILLPGDPDDRPGYSQRYICGHRDCENTVLLPEHPTEGPITVRAPCEVHGSVRHVAIGRDPAVEEVLDRIRSEDAA